jgi:hypothetical protein
VSWRDDCANCNRPIPERGNYRVNVPRLGGRSAIVCADCKNEIEPQARLIDDETGKVIGTKRRRRVA